MDPFVRNVLLGILIFFAGLIGLIVVVGLLQGTLNPAGMATLIGGLFTGVISAVIVDRNRRGPGGNA